MQISEQIIQIINILCEKFGLIIDWSQNNILPYIQQLSDKVIKYEINTSIAWIIIGILMLILSIIAIKIGLKIDDDVFSVFLTLVSIVFIIIGISVIAVQTFDIIQATSLPEKTLWEYINSYRNQYKNS